jgi:hypothetical protein
MTEEISSPDAAPLARLFWMMIGPILLFILAFANTMDRNGWHSGADIGFFIVLIATVYARWREYRAGGAQTADGQPATPAQVHRFIAATLAIGLAVWAIANAIGNYWMAN